MRQAAQGEFVYFMSGTCQRQHVQEPPEWALGLDVDKTQGVGLLASSCSQEAHDSCSALLGHPCSVSSVSAAATGEGADHALSALDWRGLTCVEEVDYSNGSWGRWFACKHFPHSWLASCLCLFSCPSMFSTWIRVFKAWQLAQVGRVSVLQCAVVPACSYGWFQAFFTCRRHASAYGSIALE